MLSDQILHRHFIDCGTINSRVRGRGVETACINEMKIKNDIDLDASINETSVEFFARTYSTLKKNLKLNFIIFLSQRNFFKLLCIIRNFLKISWILLFKGRTILNEVLIFNPLSILHIVESMFLTPNQPDPQKLSKQTIVFKTLPDPTWLNFGRLTTLEIP